MIETGDSDYNECWLVPFCRLWKEWFWSFYAIHASAAEIWIMSDCDYERSRVSNITLCATYTIYRRFLGKFSRLDTANRTSWNFAGGEADFARRGTGPRTVLREVRSPIESPRTMRVHNLYVRALMQIR